MRCKRFAAVLAAVVAVTTPAVANTFSDLSRQEPAVDRAIAAMPSSGVEGSLHRLASLIEQPRVADAMARGEALPASAERQILDAATRLESQLRTGLAALGIQDRLVMAQVVDLIVLDHARDLYGAGIVPPPCPVGTEPWGAECHPPLGIALDRLAALLEASVREGFAQWAADNPGSPVPFVPPAPADGIDGLNFEQWLDEVLEGPAGITGVETIDE